MTDTIATLIDLNDAAVNEVRDYCASQGYNAAAFYAEEAARIAAGNLTMDEYRHVRRTGSRHLASRKIRRAVHNVYTTRRALAALNA